MGPQIDSTVIENGKEIIQVPATPAKKVADKNTIEAVKNIIEAVVKRKSPQIVSTVIVTGKEIEKLPATPAIKVADKNTIEREEREAVIKHKSPQIASTI